MVDLIKFNSSLRRHLSRFGSETLLFLRVTLKEESARFKKLFIAERLSGPPGLRKRTGNLIRSLRTTVTSPYPRMRWSTKIGGPRAPYAIRHERAGGKLQFGIVWEREARIVIAKLRAGLRNRRRR